MTALAAASTTMWWGSSMGRGSSGGIGVSTTARAMVLADGNTGGGNGWQS